MYIHRCILRRIYICVTVDVQNGPGPPKRNAYSGVYTTGKEHINPWYAGCTYIDAYSREYIYVTVDVQNGPGSPKRNAYLVWYGTYYGRA